ncbi:ABC transporter ATP-binding protein [Polynucleobacter brandtiae]|uniref:ATP-binding cassette subfamily B protein n=1 Tax=Polynucleobacter brandtiae TaxID=1938816 RepID=A0A2M8VJG4_9BURK|nr:ABC transporter ATP-binding protein [Polynucleobacter brandtiae]PJI77154.1 ATP-binding cassette subfamily B protein [Polynucleobacter brandtiae]
MNNSDDTISINLVRLWRTFSHARKKQFIALILLMVLCSFSEILVIGSVVPFLALIANPNSNFMGSIAASALHVISATNIQDIRIVASIFFALSVLLAAIFRTILAWATTYFSFDLGADLGQRIYRAILNQPYSLHINRSSSKVIDSITNQVNGIVYGTTLPLLHLLSATFLGLFIFGALILVDPTITLISFIGFCVIYLCAALLTKNSLKRNSLFCAYESHRVLQSLQEGMGGIREIIIDGTQNIHAATHSEIDLNLRRAQASTLFISLAPRYPVEAMAIIVMIGVALTLSLGNSNAGELIPKLAAMALGAQRLLPLLQQTFSSWSSLQGAQHSVAEALDLLDLPSEASRLQSIGNISFKRSINIERLAFRYAIDQPLVLKNINLEIIKGSRVGLIGVTGSGKSTFLDLIMGLLEPTSGVINIDGEEKINLSNSRQWQRHIAHVPQNIFLLDRSIAENIAMSDSGSQIDYIRLNRVIRQASLEDYINSLPDKFDTCVGERGIRLSGGQRQRIGIARALYKGADLIILDEATSALDSETERAVIAELDRIDNDVTILMVSHRPETLKSCNFIYEIKNGCLKEVKQI